MFRATRRHLSDFISIGSGAMTIEIFSGALFQYCSLKVSTKRKFGAWWVYVPLKNLIHRLKTPTYPFTQKLS